MQQWEKYVDIWSKASELKFDPASLQFSIRGRKLKPEEYWKGKRTVINNDVPLEFKNLDDLLKFFTADGTGFSEWDRWASKRIEKENSRP
jgi:hypothetical protein